MQLPWTVRVAAWRLAFAVAGVLALLGWLSAGLLVAISFVVVANPSAELIVLLLKVAEVGGWLLALGWLFRELARRRWRFLLAPIAAWGWVFLVVALLGRNGTAGIGY